MRLVTTLAVAFSLLLRFESSQAAIYHKIDTTVPLKCTFSKNHQNRIAVNGGRISKIIFTGDSVAVRMEEESGQAFVRETYPRDSLVVLSVITNKGDVQDIEVSFEEKSPEVVILSTLKETQGEAGYHSPCLQDTGSVIDQILSGRNPEGFTCVDTSTETKYIRPGLRMYGIARFESKNEIIDLVRFQNCKRKKPMKVCENDLKSEKTDWIYIVEKDLSPQSETIALIAERRW